MINVTHDFAAQVELCNSNSWFLTEQVHRVATLVGFFSINKKARLKSVL